jgi:hypothetical protein
MRDLDIKNALGNMYGRREILIFCSTTMRGATTARSINCLLY